MRARRGAVIGDLIRSHDKPGGADKAFLKRGRRRAVRAMNYYSLRLMHNRGRDRCGSRTPKGAADLLFCQYSSPSARAQYPLFALIFLCCCRLRSGFDSGAFTDGGGFGIVFYALDPPHDLTKHPSSV